MTNTDSTHRVAKIFPQDITPGDVIVASHFDDAPVIGTVATVDDDTSTAYTGTYASGHAFRFRYTAKVWIRIPAHNHPADATPAEVAQAIRFIAANDGVMTPDVIAHEIEAGRAEAAQEAYANRD